MEFVPFTTEQLSYLAKQDACLAPIYEGVFAADQLPGSPEKIQDRAYIVNTKNYKCEVFDSYGLPLNWYKPSDVVECFFENFETINSNAVTLQEIESQSQSFI